ncbi:MAG: cation-translocating P-type ATPase [Saprospiraceae bacterium]
MQNLPSSQPYHAALTGLTAREVQAARKKYGLNSIQKNEQNRWVEVLKNIVLEPMFLLLLAAAGIYFLLGEYADGLVMIIAILFVSAISLYQEARSRNALQALKKLTQPNSKVIREGATVEIPTQEIVLGDLIVVEEGNLVPADAQIVQSNDFSINESILTGESFSVEKNTEAGNHAIFYGTQVMSGSAVAVATAIGPLTQLGRIGKSLEKVETSKTPLQLQVSAFVKNMAGFGFVAFLLVWGINFLQSGNVLDGLLNGLTLAMSVLPEEIPVAFATFMALGAWKLIKNGVLAKEPQTVESLGSATVICIDKTGTITENKMKLVEIYSYEEDKLLRFDGCHSKSCKRIVAHAMWASEMNPFDPMEVAIHEAYQQSTEADLRPQFRIFHEYPLSGTPPMMTHLHQNEGQQRIIAAKGGWETILAHAELTAPDRQKISHRAHALARRGYRVLGVASTVFQGNDFPAEQKDFNWHFLGLIALEDPPKPNISAVFQRFYQAGIQLKIITGDYLETALSIARQTGFSGTEHPLTGKDIMEMGEAQLKVAVEKTSLFARMFPEAKLRVVEALKANGEVVAMTGDGVNDAPALKAAHIGVAMGKRGTETAKRAASMVIVDDNLDKIAEAILLGRRIYSNFKKAVQYIISIHIPIILTVSIPLILGWKYANIFSPIHVIFFEIIMGPTCSIIFENEPMEDRLQHEKPRKLTTRFFSFNELVVSILQGLVITAGVLFLYKTAMDAGYEKPLVRNIVFTTIIWSNIFLTLVNRSFYYSIFKTLAYPNKLVPLIIAISLGILASTMFVPAVQAFFELQKMEGHLFIQSFLVAFVCVVWIEGFKWYRRSQQPAAFSEMG